MCCFSVKGNPSIKLPDVHFLFFFYCVKRSWFLNDLLLLKQREMQSFQCTFCITANISTSLTAEMRCFSSDSADFSQSIPLLLQKQDSWVSFWLFVDHYNTLRWAVILCVHYKHTCSVKVSVTWMKYSHVIKACICGMHMLL